jgi:RNA polymerase sigma-70 factor (ECF subfamily)
VAPRRSRRNDPARWVARHGDCLFRYALFRLGDVPTAEDLVQETLAAAIASRERFTGRSSERTWLIGILRHKLMDHLRRVYRERAALDELEEQAATSEFGQSGLWWNTPPAAWRVDPSVLIERREFWEALRRCLDQLPPKTAEAFSLREIDGVDSEEICKVLAISPNNLWVRLHRARAAVRRCLEKSWLDQTQARER